MICGNYRAVTLLYTTYKILANILYVKVVPYADEIIGEHLGVFRWVRWTVDQIFTETNIGKMLGTEYRCTSSIYWFSSNIWTYDTIGECRYGVKCIN